MDYFINKVIAPKIAPMASLISYQSKARSMVSDAVSEWKVHFGKIETVENLSPIEFEQWCSQILEKAGWSVMTTKASGDQGADVVANKGSYGLVLQCKLYSSAVGNKAVQEAYSAQRHYGVRASAVVTNAGFTRSAQELAHTTGVLLLHHSELSSIDDFLVEKGLPARRVVVPASHSSLPAPPPAAQLASLDDLGIRIAAAKARMT